MSVLFIHNGLICTMDQERPEAENVLVRDGSIEDVNLKKTDKRLSEAGIEEIDLKGRCLLPGFHDSHLHMTAFGFNEEEWVDLSGCRSIKAVQNKLKAHIREKKKPAGSWILGFGWDHENFEEKRMPVAADLDEVSGEHYIFIKRVCIHIAAVNSKVLKLCRIDRQHFLDNPDIGRRPDQNPDGLIFEDAMNSIVLMKKKPYTFSEIKNVIEKTLKRMRSAGLTTIQTDDMKAFPDFESKINILRAYEALRAEGRLPIRVREQIQVSSLEELKGLMPTIKSIENDDDFAVKTVKLLLDGSLGAWTAAMAVPYKDKAVKGLLNFTDEALEKIAAYCCENDYQLACHAIGDRAIAQLIKVTEKIQHKYGKNLRPRIVHCQLPQMPQIKALKALGITADIQPMFVPSDWKIAGRRLSEQSLACGYAWKTLLNCGVKISGSSDCPVESFKPLDGIQAAVTRCTKEGEPEGGWRPEQKLAVNEALALYTTGAAYTIFEEEHTGKIKEGMSADMIITDKAPYHTAENELGNIQILTTISKGRVHHENNLF